jgi:hypothetical protein
MSPRARAACAKSKIVPHQQVAHAQTIQQHIVNEGLRLLAGKRLVERQHHALVDATGTQLLELVAQVGNASRGQRGVVLKTREEVAWVRFKGHHTAGHTAVACLGAQQGQHGLVATVHTIEVANGEGTGRGQGGVMKATEDLHEWGSVVSSKCRQKRVYCP